MCLITSCNVTMY